MGNIVANMEKHRDAVYTNVIAADIVVIRIRNMNNRILTKSLNKEGVKRQVPEIGTLRSGWWVPFPVVAAQNTLKYGRQTEFLNNRTPRLRTAI
ncbi:hypothetical protein M0804_003934 [Polistes exclamans]|nr:hypothetical protein M0804_003934 [Polistes exclamans]